MLKKIIIFVLFLGAIPGYSQESINNFCKEQIISYENQDSSDFYFPHARVAHILDLISHSRNKFKLINDIYLHYITIENNNKLSLILENCLLGLLKIKINKARDDFFSFFRTNKFQDPVTKIISGHIVNKNFLALNRQVLASLQELSQREQSLFGFSSLTKEEFNNIIILDQVLEASPELIQELLQACEKIMGVFYEGHDIFTRPNIQLVENFIKLLENSPVKNNLYSILRAYKQNPSPESYNLIKAKVRLICEALTGERMAKSPSEIWASWFKIIDEVQAQIIDDDLSINRQINQIKKDYCSSNIDPIETAAYQIIMVLEPHYEGIRERIMGVI